MSERPILFSGAMVRAILEGRKTQTRRAVKKPANVPPEDFRDACEWMQRHGKGSVLKRGPCDGVQWRLPCPYGAPGDRLWVRESWAPDCEGPPYYAADYPAGVGPAGPITAENRWRWTPSIHMPRWASRITLDVVSVRVEPLQTISTVDAMAEGVVPAANAAGVLSYTTGFRLLWDSINGARPGCSWADNPWVWVVEFRRVAP